MELPGDIFNMIKHADFRFYCLSHRSEPSYLSWLLSTTDLAFVGREALFKDKNI